MQQLSIALTKVYGAQAEANVQPVSLESHAPQAAIDTQKMIQISKENAALQLRSTFGSRPAAVEL